MGKACNICIAEDHGKKVKSVKEVEAIVGKGLVNDRHFKHENKGVDTKLRLSKLKISITIIR